MPAENLTSTELVPVAECLGLAFFSARIRWIILLLQRPMTFGVTVVGMILGSTPTPKLPPL